MAQNADPAFNFVFFVLKTFRRRRQNAKLLKEVH
jgi:hypothetical protein